MEQVKLSFIDDILIIQVSPQKILHKLFFVLMQNILVFKDDFAYLVKEN